MTSSIELHAAYFYDCDNCGRECFCRGTVLHAQTILAQLEDTEDIEAVAEFFREIGGYVIQKPDEVTCSYCNTTFDVEPDY